MGPWSAAETGQIQTDTWSKVTYINSIWNCVSLCKQMDIMHTNRLNIDKCVSFEQGKSALWSHLLHYQAAQVKMEAPAESPGQSTNNVFVYFLSTSLS